MIKPKYFCKDMLKRMSENRAQKVYRILMLIMITALITAIITTIVIYQRITGTTDIKQIASNGSNSGLELTLAKIRTMLEKEYIGTLDDEKMIEGAIKGYVAGVGDEYTEYYSPEEMSNQLDEAYGNYVGIGIYMLVNNSTGEILVSKPMPNSPAEEAGIKTGDIITKVEGEEVTAENAANMSNKIKGEAGTKVKLEIRRGEETIPLEVERRKIVVSHINTKVINETIGYISIIDFDGGVAEEFKSKYEELKKQNIKSLIIDIRSNGGGVVDEAIGILEMLCNKEDTLLITTDKKGKEEITKSTQEQEIDLPVVVLTNGYSASASEILAGALKDNNRAKIVGTKTYGKGVIQTLTKLSDGSGLKMTTEEYRTPSRNKINKVGIEPDYKVELPEEIEEVTEQNDTQLKKAIELLK